MTLAILMALSSLTGCSPMSDELQAVQQLSTKSIRSLQQVMDTNAEGMKYSSFSQRTAVADYKASYNAVSETQRQKCYSLLTTVMAEHNKNGNIESEIMSQEQHDYWKNLLDDVVLENPRAQSIKEFSGYYFLTVEFTTRPNGLGSFLAAANYLGLDNCFKHDADAEPVLNEIWIAQAFKEINAQREAEGKDTYQTFVTAESSQVYTQVEETEPVVEEETVSEDTEGTTDTEGENTEDAEADVEETEAVTEETVVDNQSQNVYVSENQALGDSDIFNENLRKLEYDVDEYESILGSSQTGVAFMPHLYQVYQSATPQGAISGDGCYNEGVSGLREFGFVRDELTPYSFTDSTGASKTVDVSGTAHITFVFQQNELDKDKMDYVLAYLEDYKSNNSFIEKYDTTNYLAVPDFVQTQIEIKVEELDRLINNGDINGLMRLDVIEDAGLALKLAQYRNSADITSYTTEVKGVLAREGNVYLVEVERTIADTPKDTGYVGQYKERAYLVVRQKDLDFYINDIFTASRELTKQPQISEISQSYRQLVNLNLSDREIATVAEEIKSTVLNDWIYYCNKRIIGADGVEDYGMQGQFNTNTSVLSDTRFEYINSKMRGILLAKGLDHPGLYKVKVLEWIGGTEEQVEFTTEELISYSGTDTATKLTCYYIVSHFGNRWVIDDIKIINQEELSGEGYTTAQQNFSGSDVLLGESASNSAVTDQLGKVEQ
jgi:hypothetical protein